MSQLELEYHDLLSLFEFLDNGDGEITMLGFMLVCRAFSCKSLYPNGALYSFLFSISTFVRVIVSTWNHYETCGFEDHA